jgi:hypothetical protein
MVALAMLDGTKGVLLTRHSHRHYTFALSNLVSFGQTQERTASSHHTENAAGRPRSPEPEPLHERTIEQARTGEESRTKNDPEVRAPEKGLPASKR